MNETTAAILGMGAGYVLGQLAFLWWMRKRW